MYKVIGDLPVAGKGQGETLTDADLADANIEALISQGLRMYREPNFLKMVELIRGADIVGTPLASFAKILATSDKQEVFNGYCGAESGSVPVSFSMPSHHTSPSSVRATLVKITSLCRLNMQLGLVFMLVPGATPK